MIVVEYFFSKQYMDFHFSTMAVSVGIFSLAFVYRGDSAPLKMLLTYVGRELSMWIYLLHPFFAQLLSTVADHLGIGGVRRLCRGTACACSAPCCVGGIRYPARNGGKRAA